jgi:uncharacterized protein YoxC
LDSRKIDRNSKSAEEIANQQPSSPEDYEALDFDQLRESLHNSTETTIDHLDKLIQESSKRSNKRLYLELFRALVVDSAQASESLFFLFEYVTDLRASIIALSMETEKANGKTTHDVKRLNKKITNLLSSPAVIEIGRILQNMRKLSEKTTSQADTSVKEYLR